jgi:hypothetical protein
MRSELRALALDVGRAGLQPDDVLLLELQLDGVLDRDDPLGLRDERAQHVEQGRLPGSGAAGDDDVEPGLHAGPQQLGHLRAQRPEGDQVRDLQRGAGELADGQRGAAERQRRDDGVDAGAVGQARVDQR